MENQNDQTGAAQQPDERTALLARARMMGIPFSPNIGLETLRQRIADHLEGRVTTEDGSNVDTAIKVPENETPHQRQQRMRQEIQAEQMRLVRIRITNMDPTKANLRGEMLTVQNRYVGRVCKFIPFNDDAAELGFHVPWILYQMMLEKKFNHVTTKKGRDHREIIVQQRMVKEYNIEVLPPLTEKELLDLKNSQIARGSEYQDTGLS